MKAILWCLPEDRPWAANAAKWVPRAYLCREEVVFTQHGPRVSCELAAFLDPKLAPRELLTRWGTVTHPLFPDLEATIKALGWKINRLDPGSSLRSRGERLHAAGRQVGGPAPMGYRWESGVLVEAPEEAKFIRWLFGEALRTGLRKIVRKLDKEGTWTRKGKVFRQSSLFSILKNKTYLGLVKLNGSWKRGAHEPLIAPILFNKVQAKMRRRSLLAPDKKSPRSPDKG
ncbi:MAG: hypothetical protein E6Q97_10500 [Desulfurellales bacterium]|nr:MAG: hypothetical protein E6Q97_10500 [Desulfurellales bacterium]